MVTSKSDFRALLFSLEGAGRKSCRGPRGSRSAPEMGSPPSENDQGQMQAGNRLPIPSQLVVCAGLVLRCEAVSTFIGPGMEKAGAKEAGARTERLMEAQ